VIAVTYPHSGVVPDLSNIIQSPIATGVPPVKSLPVSIKDIVVPPVDVPEKITDPLSCTLLLDNTYHLPAVAQKA
jgi:hypothetical protein